MKREKQRFGFYERNKYREKEKEGGRKEGRKGGAIKDVPFLFGADPRGPAARRFPAKTRERSSSLRE